MRRLPLALLMLLAAAPSPLRAQAWDGWGPCPGPCGLRGGAGWDGAPPDARWRFGLAQGFAPGAWWSPRAMRWRRFAARQAAMDAAGETPRPPRIAPPGARFAGWVWHPRAPQAVVLRRAEPDPAPIRHRDGEAVAALPVGALRPARLRPHPLVPSRVLAAAAMLRRATPAPHPIAIPAVAAVGRPPEPPPRPAEERRAAEPPHRPRVAAAPRRPIRPASLRSDPASLSPEPALASPAATLPAPLLASPVAPASAAQASAPAAEVPVAPLE